MRIKEQGVIETPKNNLRVIGTVKTGFLKESNGKSFPTSTDYFILESKAYQAEIDKIFEKPAKLSIIFVSDNTDISCSEYYELTKWTNKKGSIYAMGDGEVFSIYNEKTTKYERVKISEFPNLFEGCLKKFDPKGELKLAWKKTLKLTFILVELKGVLGVFQFTTHGEASSIPNLRSSFDAILESVGTVVNIPFDLIVKKHKSMKPDQSNQYSVVDLVPNISHESQLKLADYKALGNDIKQLALTKVLNNDFIKQLK